jgi:integrase
MEYLTPEELKSLLQTAYEQDRLAHLAILCSLVHALRVSEMRQLTVAAVDGSYLRVTALKDGPERLEPLHLSCDPLYNEGALAVHANGVREQGGKLLFGLSRQAWDAKIKALCKRAGIASGKAHWHSLRHSTAMLVFKNTVSLGAVKQTLRHRSWSSSLVYLNESDSQKGYDAVQQSLKTLATSAQEKGTRGTIRP